MLCGESALAAGALEAESREICACAWAASAARMTMQPPLAILNML
jgi:hypothetical protein